MPHDKTCRSCGIEKPINNFNKDSTRPDGHGVYCRPCSKEIQAKWYENRYGSVHPMKRLRTKPAKERFISSYCVDTKSGCWIWKGRPQGSNGYGRIKVSGQQIQAHRYSWELARGRIPDGQLVLHACDTPLCVNPNHLFIGTHQDNMDDKTRKGRQACGPELAKAQQLGRMAASELRN